MKSFLSETEQTTQRVRVGMIGLAAVLLFVGLAAAVLSMVGRDRAGAAAGTSRSQVVDRMLDNQAAAARDREPLAELGAAPSATPAPKRR